MHRHNNVRNLTSQLLKEVCYDVRSEPVLLDPLKELDDLPKSAIQNPESWADISASGFCRLAERLAEKRNESKSDVISAIRRKISFSMLRSTVTCLRDDRSSRRFNLQ